MIQRFKKVYVNQSCITYKCMWMSLIFLKAYCLARVLFDIESSIDKDNGGYRLPFTLTCTQWDVASVPYRLQNSNAAPSQTKLVLLLFIIDFKKRIIRNFQSELSQYNWMKIFLVATCIVWRHFCRLMGAVMSIPAKVNLCLYEIIRDLIIYYDIHSNFERQSLCKRNAVF